MSKVHLYLERFWLVVAIILTIVQIIYTIMEGISDKLIQSTWLIVVFVWGMYLLRRGVRKRMDKHEANKPKKKNK